MTTATATRPRTARAPQPAAPHRVEEPRRGTGQRRPVHLTTRGRIVVLLVLVALLLGAFLFGRSASHASVSPEPQPTLTQVTVRPGDTLWSIARAVAPGHDPRKVVEQLQRLNGLPGGGLQAGQQLLLPLSV